MTHQEFNVKYPMILDWIEQTLARQAGQAQNVTSLGFKRLPQFFSADVLSSAKVIYVDPVPKLPLTALGLGQFAEFESMDPAGITYLDTFFSRTAMRPNESHHFHELVHVLQWQILGPKRFIALYAYGVEQIGYRQSPLEMMAYGLESVFRNSNSGFDVATVVREELEAMLIG